MDTTFLESSQRPDPWVERIARWQREDLPPERIKVRQDGEARARALLESQAGQFSEADLNQFRKDLNADWWGGERSQNRFAPAFANIRPLEKFNDWVKKLWDADDTELDTLLDEFWKRGEVKGAGISLPTAILYLRDSEQYNIWLPVMSKGLEMASGFRPGKMRTARGYRDYNAALNDFRDRHSLPPQALDAILWKIQQEEKTKSKPRTVYTGKQFLADTYLTQETLKELDALLNDKHQIILYGPPGTGKTYVAQKFARYFVDGDESQVQIIQFHPSYSYEEFMEGIRPEARDDGPPTYPVRPGAFRTFCEKARGQSDRFVMIIDEINRGNIAKIFGELMFLLEYRDHQVPLPYSGAQFSIPDNVYLIGTMNTADRSIALVDFALRRRFHFVHFSADRAILERWIQANDAPVTYLLDLFDEVNRAIDDRDYRIGFSYFMKPGMTEADLRRIWRYSIEPYLEEYFFDNRAKVEELRWDALVSRLRGNE